MTTLHDGALAGGPPMAPRIANGVPAAMPQAPATIMTEIVERRLWVMMKVSTAQPRRSKPGIRPAGPLVVEWGAGRFRRFDRLDDPSEAGSLPSRRYEPDNPGLVDRSGDKHGCPRTFSIGIDSPVTVDWSRKECPADYRPVYRDPSAGP